MLSARLSVEQLPKPAGIIFAALRASVRGSPTTAQAVNMADQYDVTGLTSR
jgi:hypothetical protein